jgi:hypothetical protein
MAMKFERLKVKLGKRLRQRGFLGFADDVFFIAKAFRHETPLFIYSSGNSALSVVIEPLSFIPCLWTDVDPQSLPTIGLAPRGGLHFNQRLSRVGAALASKQTQL